METTLIQELEQAAYETDCTDRACPDTCTRRVRAARLRQRAAWVRELLDLVHAQKFNGGRRELARALTGPIPSETAPAIAAAIDKTFEQDAGLLRRLADSPRPTPVQEAARMWREGETAPAASVGLVVPVCAAGCGRPVKGGDGTEALYCDEHAPAAPREGTVKP